MTNVDTVTVIWITIQAMKQKMFINATSYIT